MSDAQVLYLIRHATPEEDGTPDPVLTPKGQEQAARLATILHQKTNKIDVLITSPLNRARQTAAAIGKQYGNIIATSDSRLSENSANALTLIEELRKGDSQTLVLVTHQPIVGQLLAHFDSTFDPGEITWPDAFAITFSGQEVRIEDLWKETIPH